MATAYRNETEIKYLTRLKQVLIPQFPEYVEDFFISEDNTSTARTLVSYAYDILAFYRFLLHRLPERYGCDDLIGKTEKDITLEHLAMLKSKDIASFTSRLQNMDDDVKSKASACRQYSSIRSFFKYLYDEKMIPDDVTKTVKRPEYKSDNYIFLEPDEIAILLEGIENHATNMEAYLDHPDDKIRTTKHGISYQKRVQKRDLAIVTLFLTTGIRISELVGINMEDITFTDNSIKITRKGNKDDRVFFNEEAEVALLDYIKVRSSALAHLSKDERPDALFLSLQRKRICVQAVEDLVVKYAKAYIPQKKITPHKLRHTFASTIYNSDEDMGGGDIHLIKDLLGHESIVSSQIYAHQNKERVRAVARNLQVRSTKQ